MTKFCFAYFTLFIKTIFGGSSRFDFDACLIQSLKKNNFIFHFLFFNLYLESINLLNKFSIVTCSDKLHYQHLLYDPFIKKKKNDLFLRESFFGNFFISF